MIQVIHQGLGPIGLGTAKLVLEDSDLKIVEVIETDTNLVGKDLGSIMEKDEIGLRVTDTLNSDGDVLVLATISKLIDLLPSITKAAEKGINIISPCEELFYPNKKYWQETEYLDKLAKKHNIRILATGVNPGLLMDRYPLKFLKEKKVKFTRLKINRWDNTHERRRQLLDKTGIGQSIKMFYSQNIGHSGLVESASFLADGLGWKDYKIDFSREPEIARDNVNPLHGGEIPAGGICGLRETCYVRKDNSEIVLDLRMFVGCENNNSIIVDDKKVDDYSNIVNGDIATMRILKEAIKSVTNGPPGFNTVDFVPDPKKLLV